MDQGEKEGVGGGGEALLQGRNSERTKEKNLILVEMKIETQPKLNYEQARCSSWRLYAAYFFFLFHATFSKLFQE